MVVTLHPRARAALATLALMLSILLGVVDYHAGPDFSIGALYVVPVGIAAWYTSPAIGMLVSIICSAAWFYCLHLQMPWEIDLHPAIVFWNFVSGLAIFLAQVYTITRLKRTLRRESDAARTDALTGSHNSRSFRELAATAVRDLHESSSPCTLLYFDVDHFKQVNDSCGHFEGDQLLRTIATTVRANLRPQDALARLGGDEFAVLLPAAGADEAARIAGRLQDELTRMAERGGWPVSFSMGMCTYAIAPQDLESMIRAADAVMYAVKSSGKHATRHHIETAGDIVTRDYPAPAPRITPRADDRRNAPPSAEKRPALAASAR